MGIGSHPFGRARRLSWPLWIALTIAVESFRFARREARIAWRMRHL